MMNSEKYMNDAYEIFKAATPAIRIHGVGGKRWKRNVTSGSRIGPWLQAQFEIVNRAVWEARRPCLYLVADVANQIRYVGISRNRLKDRWRVSPAIDAQTMAPMRERQLFHSQCWKHIERESERDARSRYEVRCIDGEKLCGLLKQLGPPLSGLLALGGDEEGVVAAVERWMCNNKGPHLPLWNSAMTSS
jgi:hypothetical protein